MRWEILISLSLIVGTVFSDGVRAQDLKNPVTAPYHMIVRESVDIVTITYVNHTKLDYRINVSPHIPSAQIGREFNRAIESEFILRAGTEKSVPVAEVIDDSRKEEDLVFHVDALVSLLPEDDALESAQSVQIISTTVTLQDNE